jgi:rhodanese-related sulfurtransferase
MGLVSIIVACYVSPRFFVKSAYTLVKHELADIPDISNQMLLDLSNNQNMRPVIVDVRSPEEQEISIIKGSIDKAFFEQHLDDYEKRKIVVYCTIGYRSGYYVESLRQQGFDAYNLSEGILGWIQAGGSLVNSNGEITSKIHVYSRPWDLGVKNHVAVY